MHVLLTTSQRYAIAIAPLFLFISGLAIIVGCSVIGAIILLGIVGVVYVKKRWSSD